MSTLHASKLYNLTGAVALVTGGGTGIGLMCSRALAANGARVYITGRRAEAVEKAASEHTSKLDGSLIALQGDVTSKSDLSRIASEISSREGGKLHVLVNNAGIAGSQGAKTKLDVGNVDAEQYAAKHLESETLEGWNKVFETNVAGVFFTTMSLLPLLVAGNASPPQCCLETGSDDKLRPWHASIINITSISGQVKTNQNHYAYNASKASATHLTQMLSHELRFHAGFGVRVNAIAPGVFPSEMTTDTSGNDPKGAGMTHPETGKLREMAGPPGRPGTEEEMANLCLMLATNTYVNGQVVAVDGGYTAATPSNR